MTLDRPLATIRTVATLRQQAVTLRADPRFPEVLGSYTAKLVEYRQASRRIAKLIANEDRYRAFNFFYHLWAEKVAAGGDGSVSYGELFEICRRGEVSPRILKTMLSLGVFTRFLERREHPQDGRVALYAPSAGMLAFPLRWLMPAAEAVDELEGGPSRADRLKADPAVLVHFFRSAGREFGNGVQPMTLQPEFMAFFGQMEGGSVVTKALIVAEGQGSLPPSRLEMAERFGLTRSQVTKVVAVGQSLGFIAQGDGILRTTAALRDSHAEWVSLSLAFLGHHLQQ